MSTRKYEILDLMQAARTGLKPAGPASAHDRFPETSWTLLAKAREASDEGARAKEDFARRYYRPVEGFLRTLVVDEEKARELSQEFFVKISAPGGLLERADREKGVSFRSFLKQALRNLVIDRYRRSRKEILQAHPDQAGAEGWAVLETAQLPAAEAAFHDAWVKVTLAEALAQVRTLCLKRKQDVHLELFEARYLSEGDLLSWDELGAPYGMDEKTARGRAETVARHFRIVLRRMLRNEIALPDAAGHVTEAAIDDEVRVLLSPLKE